jgi:uncharacterized damage-inducible protein DinB
MSVAEFRVLFAYDEWANARLLLADLFRHVVNHSTCRRGQAATLLRRLGAKAPATDDVVFRGEAQ